MVFITQKAMDSVTEELHVGYHSSIRSSLPRFLTFFLLLQVFLFTAGCGNQEQVQKEESPTVEKQKHSTDVSSETLSDHDRSSDAKSETNDLTDAVSVPELRGTDKWINSNPFTLESQKGKVVLIDFWTYTCVNCIRTLPYLRLWHEAYADAGLVILGVHTPEFEFEKVYENLLRATQEFSLEYPVVQDNQFETWKAFGNSVWPAKYLIDQEGVIRYTHFGEGKYQETEQAIRKLLAETATDLQEPVTSSIHSYQLDSAARVTDVMLSQTRELYAGYLRNYGVLASGQMPPYILNTEYYEASNEELLYSDPGDHVNHFLYIEGLWRNDAEYLVHARTTLDHEDYVAVKFYGSSVNAVMDTLSGDAVKVQITIDSQPINVHQAGFDIEFDSNGNSYVNVTNGRMYNLLNKDEFGTGELQLSSNSPEFSLYAFTFGSYLGGEREF